MESNITKSKIASDLLVFVVGISGSGKDTIMRNVADTLLLEDIPVNILQRNVTRLPDKTEESLYISEEEFLQRKSEKEFTLSWFVYNNWYGCPCALLEEPLQRGEIVLVNVSRNILHEAREKYPQSKIVLIEVPIKIAEKRVKTRGRETYNHLVERFTRMQEEFDMPTPDKIILNDGDLENAIHELSHYLKQLFLDFKQKNNDKQKKN